MNNKTKTQPLSYVQRRRQIEKKTLQEIDNILVTGGILAKDLGIKFWQVAEDENLKKVCNNYNIFPNYIISNLRI